MRKAIVVLQMVFLQGFIYAQSPIVPRHMSVGDIKIKITEGARAEIQKNVDELTKNPKYFNAKVDLANQYFHFIEAAFKKGSIPEDIKYLAIQESGLVSDVVSTSNAVGYWQFKDFTAIEVGMRVDRHVDERKNIYSASVGAAKYMKTNNKFFDNWIYTIQAFQMGAGGALKVTDKKLYGAKQMTISKKTYWYVKKYLAHKVAYESAVGKSKPSIFLSEYRAGAGKSLQEIAKKFKVSQEELTKYNKWLKKGKVPSDKEYSVIIPNKKLVKIADDRELLPRPKSVLVKKAPSYNQSQSKHFPKLKPWKGSSKYSGSTVNINKLPGIIGVGNQKLIDLARKGNVSLGDFLSINDIEIDHKVADGTPYYFKKKKKKAKVYYHVVRQKETLWSISQKYGIQLKKLLVKNRIHEMNTVNEGRVLWMRHIRPENVDIVFEELGNNNPIEITINQTKAIHAVEENNKLEQIEDTFEMKGDLNTGYDSLSNSDYTKLTHTVSSGETFYSIANRYDVQVLELVSWNKLLLTDKLSINQNLIILKPKEELGLTESFEKEKESFEKENKKYHTVEKGDTLYSISIKYDIDLEELRNINNKSNGELAIGERLKVSSDK